VRVKPSLDRTKDTALEDRPRVARRGMRAEMEAALKNRDARAAAGKAVSDSGPADPGANDRHINCFGQVAHSSDWHNHACCSLYRSPIRAQTAPRQIESAIARWVGNYTGKISTARDRQTYPSCARHGSSWWVNLKTSQTLGSAIVVGAGHEVIE
jgi:hypothetical protein